MNILSSFIFKKQDCPSTGWFGETTGIPARASNYTPSTISKKKKKARKAQRAARRKQRA